MKTSTWRDIRARKFPPDKLDEIDRTVMDELQIAELRRSASDLANGRVQRLSRQRRNEKKPARRFGERARQFLKVRC